MELYSYPAVAEFVALIVTRILTAENCASGIENKELM
jgi:hypothetical protein